MAEYLERSSSSSSPPRCELDVNGCLSFADILCAFDAPINEEQAWAICYQSAKCLAAEWRSRPATRILSIAETSQLLIHKDGFVHGLSTRKTSNGDESGLDRMVARSEAQLVTDLGVVIYRGLDYKLPEDQERNLSAPLEALMERMMPDDLSFNDSDRNCWHDADEGIEADQSDDRPKETDFTLDTVIQSCVSHLGSAQAAESHYKAVCRALVAESLELSLFLHQISFGTKNLSFNGGRDVGSSADLDNLHIQDWSRLWVQVIHELRRGVNLKKVEPNPQPIEFALTPYEILMEDIRQRRYTLNKVMVNGDIPPRVKKDAHALILEFIRSRPPLKPVWKRRLPPSPPIVPNAYEQLMHSIRREHKLKPTPDKTVETSRTKLDEADVTPQPTRKLIKADLGRLLHNLNNSDHEDDDDDDDDYSLSLNTPQQQHSHCVVETCTSDVKSPYLKTVARDLAVYSEVIIPERRHSLSSMCRIDSGMFFPCTLSQKPLSLPLKLPARTPAAAAMQWCKQPLECLSLTLEEVVHIRSELTKAELETMLADTPHYNDILKRKLCFICQKTKFSLFGPWSQKCRLCKRTICERCCSKMHIPTEHFANIPVYTLSPCASFSDDESTSPKGTWRLKDLAGFLTGSTGSVPSSPVSPPRTEHSSSSQPTSLPPIMSPDAVSDMALPESDDGDTTTTMAAASLPYMDGRSTMCRRRPRAPLLRSWTISRPERSSNNGEHPRKLTGSLTTVCRECKDMLRHIILASRGSLNGGGGRHRSERLTATFPRRIKNSTSTTQLSTNGGRSTTAARDTLHLNLSTIY